MDIVCGFFDANLFKESFFDTLRASVLREGEVVEQLIDIHASSSKLQLLSVPTAHHKWHLHPADPTP